MTEIVNTSFITDYSGELPVVTYSNPVTTVIRQTPPARITTRIYYCQLCNCCDDSCNCGCNGCCGCNCNF